MIEWGMTSRWEGGRLIAAAPSVALSIKFPAWIPISVQLTDTVVRLGKL